MNSPTTENSSEVLRLLRERAARQRQMNVDLPHEVNNLPNTTPVQQPPIVIPAEPTHN